MLFTCVAPRTKSKGLLIGGPLFSKTLILFTRIAPIQKVRGSRSAVPYSAKNNKNRGKACFYTCSTVYKKQGAPDRWSPHLLLLSARVLPHTKSKVLHRYVLQICYSINQVSIFFADRRESSSLSIIKTISHQIPIDGSIYFLYINVIYIQEVRDIYLYLDASSSSNMQKKKITKPWGCRCHRTRQDE
jgi:hypothetical protein